MAQTYEFTLNRARKSRGAQDDIQAKWMWSDKTLAQWDADIEALEKQNETLAATKVFKTGAPEGELIRSSVPTTTTTSGPSAPPEPPQSPPPTPPSIQRGRQCGRRVP